MNISLAVTPLSGSQFTIANAQIVQGSFTIDRASTSGNNLEMGSATASECTFTLNNADGTFNNKAFEGATISVTVDSASYGVFYVDEVTYGKTTISVVALDGLVKFDNSANKASFGTNRTPLQVLTTCCTQCGITLGTTTDMINTTAKINIGTIKEDITYRDIISWVGELTGTNAYMSDTGTLCMGWYKSTSSFTLTESNRTSSNMQGYAVLVTGVKVIDGETTYLSGTEDYPIVIESNPIIGQDGIADRISNIANRVVGFAYQPFNATVLSSAEVLALRPMDRVTFTKDGTNYNTILTNTLFTLNQDVQVASKGDSIFAKGYAKLTKAQQTALQSLQQQTDIVTQDLQYQIDNISVGGFNLLLDTNAPSLTKVYADKNRYWSDNANTTSIGQFITVANPPQPNITYGIEIENTEVRTSSKNKALAWYQSGKTPLVEGEEYTLSAYFRVTEGEKATAILSFEGNNNYYEEISGSEWQRVAFTFTAPNNNPRIVYVGTTANYVGKIEACGFQLEHGSIATSYAPSPTETQSQLNNLTTTTNNLTTATNNLTTTTNNLTTTTNGLVTTTEGLTQATNDLTTRLDELRIGGTNILRGTAEMLLNSSHGKWQYGAYYRAITGSTGFCENVTLTDSPVSGVTKGVRLAQSVTTENVSIAQSAIPFCGEGITFSVWVKGESGIKVRLNAYGGSNPAQQYKDFTLTDSNWTRLTYSTTVTPQIAVAGAYIYLMTDNSYSGLKEILICAPKMEYGSQPTDWSKSPFDDTDLGQGRNLLKKSNEPKSSTAYLFARYYYGDLKPIHGEVYTLQIKGQLGADKIGWYPYNSGGSYGLYVLGGGYRNDNNATSPYTIWGDSFYDDKTGIYTAKIVWRAEGTTNTYLNLYALPNETTENPTTIEWVKLEKGTTPTGWLPAPEDVEDEITALTNYINTEISTIETQVDGKIETFYQTADPSTNWTAEQKSEHEGDIWQNSSTGKTYRWSGTAWQEMTTTPPSAIIDTIDGKAQVFISQPTPPYQTGDLWFNSTTSDIMTCVTARASGNYTASDWQKRNKYTDDTAVNTFISGTYATDKTNLQSQIDGKAETWYQSADPSTAWTTAELKAQHEGDLWYKTTDHTTWFYNGTTWEQQEVPTAVFDKIDGKAQVFTSQPTPPYSVGDLWFNSASSDIMTCMTARASGNYTASDWVKRNKYTDDTAVTTFISGTYATDKTNLQTQIDKKAETWYQASDPSTAWTTTALKTEHKGDLWYNTSNGTTWYYNGTSWEQQNVPTAVFDEIDGKAQIFTSQPTVPYHVGDLWFNSTSDEILTCMTARTTGSFTASDWVKRNKYTDDTAVENLEIGGRNYYITSTSVSGFLNTSGTITNASTVNKERTSDFISVTAGEKITAQVWVTLTESQQAWLAYCFYKSDKTLLGSRVAKYSTAGVGYLCYEDVAVPTEAEYVRCSARLFNDGLMKLEKGSKPTDWTPAPEDTQGEIDTLNTTTSNLTTTTNNLTTTTNNLTTTTNNLTTTTNNLTTTTNNLTTKTNALETTTNGLVTTTNGLVTTTNTLTETTQSLQEQINNLDIGGVNLLLDTNAPSLTKVYADYNRYWSNAGNSDYFNLSMVQIDNPPQPNIRYGAQQEVISVNASKGRFFAFYSSGHLGLVNGETYTASAYYKVTSGTSAKVLIQCSCGAPEGTNVTETIDNSGWHRLVFTFTPTTAVDGTVLYFGGYATELGLIIQICGFQLEKGGYATTYNRPFEGEMAVTQLKNYFWYDSAGAHVTSAMNDATTGYNTLITSTAVDVRDGVTSMASFGNPTRIGTTSGRNLYITPSALEARTGTTVDASFGATTLIGHTDTDNKNVQITDSALRLRNGTDTHILLGHDTTSAYAMIGQNGAGQQNVIVRPSSINFRTQTTADASIVYDSTNATPKITLGRTGSGQRNTYITNSAFQLRTGTTVDASFGYDSTTSSPIITLGRTGNNQKNVYITNTALQTRTGTTVDASFGETSVIGRSGNARVEVKPGEFNVIDSDNKNVIHMTSVSGLPMVEIGDGDKKTVRITPSTLHVVSGSALDSADVITAILAGQLTETQSGGQEYVGFLGLKTTQLAETQVVDNTNTVISELTSLSVNKTLQVNIRTLAGIGSRRVTLDQTDGILIGTGATPSITIDWAGGITTDGTVTAGNLTSNGLITGTSVSVSGNIVGTNITGTGTVKGATLTSTGNITASGNISATSGTVTAKTLSVTNNATVSGTISTSNGQIGQVLELLKDTAVSVSSGTVTSLGSLAIGKGTWVVTATVQWGANTNGVRLASINTTSSTISGTLGNGSTVAPTGGYNTKQTFTRVLTNTSSVTYYLTVQQTSGSALNCYGRLQAVRIC